MGKIDKIVLEKKGNFYDIKEVNGYRLLGMCVRCGQCCLAQGCEYLIMETLNNEPSAQCTVYPNRPASCMLFPMPDDELPETCGYKYMKIGK